MKKIFLLLFTIGLTVTSKAQSVGIGTTTPNSKAALDISSTTQGVLIPRMTTTERNAILFPPDGLLIFNTTTKMLNQRQDGVWKAMINNYSWEGGGTGKMYNVGDSVGLNIASPSERLDVNGNIRTNSSAIIDNSSAILQLKSGGVNKGFVQVNGDNLRLGTNTENPNGNLVVRLNGNDRFSFEGNNSGSSFMRIKASNTDVGLLQGLPNNNVTLSTDISNSLLILNDEIYVNKTANRTGIGTTTPSERLDVNGNTKISGAIEIGSTMNISGEVNRPSTGSYNLLPVCYGRVSSGGSLLGGTDNITGTNFDGSPFYNFRVDCAAITTSSIVQITCAGSQSVSVLPVVSVYNGHFDVKFFSEFLKSLSDPNIIGTQTAFHFIVYNP